MNNGTIFILAVCVLILVPNASAMVKEKSLNDLTQESDDIITGNVIGKNSYWENGNIFTDITVSADRHIKGKYNNQFVIKILGGTVGDIHEDVSDIPLFENNEEVLLFLKENKVLGWNQGKYTIIDNKIKETGEHVSEFIYNIEQNLSTSATPTTSTTPTISTTPSILYEDVAQVGVPHIIDITPNSGPAKSAELGSTISAPDSTEVTINGSSFGTIKGSVKFWHVGTGQYDATILSWTDTKIVARVPGRISSYAKPDGNGNVRVINSDGISSDNYGNFGVTYSYGGGKWSKNNITYKVNSSTADTTEELAAVQAAADTWSNTGADFKLTYGGESSKTGAALNGENSILWVDYNTGSIATTIIWWSNLDTKTILESDIILNDLYFNWGTDSSPTKMDIQTIMTHEFGHWLQLLDLYGSGDNKKMMYGYAGNGLIKRTLGAEDIDGIKAIYGLVEDKIAPNTVISGATEGAIYNHSVGIVLSATDNVGGSGVKNTTYIINNGDMITYTMPFIVPNIGKNKIIYRSTDNAGNTEKNNSISFTIINEDILAYYRGLGQYPNIVETSDLLKAADDWRDNIIPQGYPASITTNQLLTIADEWRNS